MKTGKQIARKIATGKRPPIADLMNKGPYRKTKKIAKKMIAKGMR